MRRPWRFARTRSQRRYVSISLVLLSGAALNDVTSSRFSTVMGVAIRGHEALQMLDAGCAGEVCRFTVAGALLIIGMV